MSDEEPKRRNTDRGGWEQHFGTMVMAVLVALILWVGNEVQTMGKEQIRQSGNINLISQRLTAIEEDVKFAATDRYTGEEAKSDKKAMHTRTSKIEDKLELYEKRLDKIEMKNGS